MNPNDKNAELPPEERPDPIAPLHCFLTNERDPHVKDCFHSATPAQLFLHL